MLICKVCGEEQVSGKFCGKCGSPELEEIISESTEEPEHESILDESEKDEKEKSAENIDPIEGSVVEPVDVIEEELKETVNDEQKLDEEVEQLTQAEIDKKVQAEVDARVAAQLAASKEQERHEATNEKMNDVKEKTSEYGYYFLDVLTNPTRALGYTENKLMYSFINAVLFALLASTFVYRLVVMATLTPPFIKMVGPFALTMLIIMGTIILATFLMAQLTFDRPNLKQVMAQYGALLIPAITLQLIAILLTFVGINSVALILTIIAAILIVYIMPFQLINEYEARREVVGQRVYLNIATIIVITIAIVFLSFVLIESLSPSLVYLLDDLFYYL